MTLSQMLRNMFYYQLDSVLMKSDDRENGNRLAVILIGNVEYMSM